MRHVTFTGKKRLKAVRSFWGKERLVLQIQERGLHTWYSAGHPDTDWVTRWRDATTADLGWGFLDDVQNAVEAEK